MKEVVYIGNFKLSKEDAESQLVLGNAYAFREMGYPVTLIGNDNSLASESIVSSKRAIDGFTSYNVSFSKSLQHLTGSRIEKQIESILDDLDVFMVVAYGSLGLSSSFYRLAKYCKKRGALFVPNCVDLSSTHHGNPFARAIKTVDRKLRYRITSEKADGIIAVSEYIKNYFASKTMVPIVVVPPLRDKTGFLPPERKMGDLVKLVYAGVPFPVDGRNVSEEAYKDRLDIAIECLSLLSADVSFTFDIYGITESEYLSVVPQHEKNIQSLGGRIAFHGRVSQTEIRHVLANADYTLLLRSTNQMTMAGFSSKLVDSICAGVPVITTHTSDYGTYLSSEKHCFFIDLDESKTDRLAEILSLGRDRIEAARQACFEFALFDYRFHIEALLEFVSSCKERASERFE
ncbi:glycosyltransferase [Eggerthella sinensis]|uniref:glycosyltransferase n=1 Tax=Eggerthella sinensis TaxID=242230 RepID=UPI00248DD84A|nr:glycosyltransferase [Eggerthella sinensis]